MTCGWQLVFSDEELLVVHALWPLDNISYSSGFVIKVSNFLISTLVSGHNIY